ncbi:patatin-like phospholipase family protein [Anditalea andensis]|uniref:PNPLA domain-containing protein n=1 Tax=Anditalea andensis TaxID=1048983 RepID=A0A074LP77_9BACT|nr:patatin-like phospholipase family protein [Anditalea andensis]KEO75717.1 hypothetical protein EL17_22075 [Anditalea andensis]
MEIPNTSKPKTFYLGLCLAGAVSAGAYTAGAMDYLLEALEDWQMRKSRGDVNVPKHDVVIPVIGGASAGGMTGAIMASAMHDPIPPVKLAPDPLLAQVPSNKFYHSWVDLVADDMIKVMLDTSDLNQQNMQSLLNTDFIDQIAARALTVSAGAAVKREYLDKQMKLFFTLSNLEGMDFDVAFRSNLPNYNRYIITSHKDYLNFRMAESASDYKADGWIPLNFQKQLNADLAKQAAIATGAFPIIFRPRKITRDGQYLNDLKWFDPITKAADRPFDKGPYKTLNVDGGMINNEPFEKVRRVLIDITGQKDPNQYQSYQSFNSTVLMVDPFPSQPGKFTFDTKLTSVMGNTLTAIINQSRIKPETLIQAMDSELAGQFLVAPIRYGQGTDENYEGRYAIASGSMSGFGGFINKEFRIHDYFLGRANCEKFLRDHFTVPQDTENPIFKEGYSKIDKSVFISEKNNGLQIIPIFSRRKNEPYMPIFSNGQRWPSATQKEISGYRNALKKRVESVLFNLADYSPTEKALLWVGAKILLNGKVADSIIDNALSSLNEFGLLRHQ